MANKGFTLWFTGLSGAGKTTLANILSERLKANGVAHEVLDGDVVRTNLSKGLGFSKEDRDTNIRRIGFVAKLLSRNNVPVITAAISPYRSTREEVRKNIGAGFIEIYVKAELKTLIKRDVKGLYEKALKGEIKGFTGVSDPYEPPTKPEIEIDTDVEGEIQAADRIWNFLLDKGYVKAELAELKA